MGRIIINTIDLPSAPNPPAGAFTLAFDLDGIFKKKSSGGTITNIEGGTIGPGTIGTLPVFTSFNVVADSIVTQDLSGLHIAGPMTITSPGSSAFYAADYSSFFTNRSLIDKGYLDSRLTTVGTVNKYATTFTPGTVNVANTITHSLGTVNFIVQLWDVTTGKVMMADIGNATSTHVDITFNSNPAGNVKVVVLG